MAGEGPGGGHCVPAVGRDERVRHRPDPPAAPPRGLGVRGDPDGPGHVRRPAVARLHEPVIVAGREVEDGLAVGRVDHLADVAHDERAPCQAAEVDGFQVREEGVVAFHGHNRLPRLDRIPLVQGTDLDLVPAVAPPAPRLQAARAPAQHGDRLVDAPENRGLALEDLHEDARMVILGFEQGARVREVRVE